MTPQRCPLYFGAGGVVNLYSFFDVISLLSGPLSAQSAGVTSVHRSALPGPMKAFETEGHQHKTLI
jgi:hypothetical protein